jgi:hypothetical protein
MGGTKISFIIFTTLSLNVLANIQQQEIKEVTSFQNIHVEYPVFTNSSKISTDIETFIKQELKNQKDAATQDYTAHGPSSRFPF